MSDSIRAHAQGCCKAEQQAVLDVLREAAGAPLTLGQIARLASSRLPPLQRGRIGNETDVACILATLRLREGFRRAIRKHPIAAPVRPRPSPEPPAPSAARAFGVGSVRGQEKAIQSASPGAASRTWPLGFPVLAATGLVAGCAAIAPPQHHVLPTPVTYFPGGVIAKTEVPRSFQPFDARTVTSCTSGWGCFGPHLEAVAESAKTPLGGPLAYHSDGYAGHFAQVSPRMRAWLNAPTDIPAEQATSPGGSSPTAIPATALAAASGAGPLAAPPLGAGAPPTTGSGLRFGAEAASSLWAPLSVFKTVTAALPERKPFQAAPSSGQDWVAEQLARIDPSLPELHARPGPTRQAAAIIQAHPQAHRPAELLEVTSAHLVIAFESGSQRVTPRMREALRHVAGSLNAQDELQLRGRVGFRSPGAVGRALAANRANAIRAELVALGVPAARITVAAPRDGDLLAGDFDSPLNRSVSMITLHPTNVALSATKQPAGG